MKRLLALVHREYWENKGAFRTTPLVIGGLYIVFLLMSIFTTATPTSSWRRPGC